MKSKPDVMKFLIFVLIGAVMASCSSDRLISKSDVRRLDLVKVGAPDPAPARVIAKLHQIEESGFEGAVAVESAETSLPVQQIAGQAAPGVEIASAEQHLTFRMPALPSNTKSVGKSLNTLVQSPLKKVEDQVLRSQNENQERNAPNINLIRLLLYILVAILIITILGMIIPGRLLSIVLLVLLIVGLLYLLGEI
jgi:hypothetical protein